MTNSPTGLLCPELNAVLATELAAGNAVRQSGPVPGAPGTLVLLSRSFLASPEALPAEIYLVPLDDPHWWKAEYRCRLHPHVLACPFD